MEQDVHTNETQVETQESQVLVEETNTEESNEETLEAKLATAQAEAAKYRRLFEKKQNPTKEPQAPSHNLNVEEAVLLSQDVPEELIDELKLRAAKYGGSLIRAQKDPNYLVVKERFEKDQKKKETSLPASRGAGNVRVQKTLTSPGLSREEHMELAKKIS